jgi:hypothetical protein
MHWMVVVGRGDAVHAARLRAGFDRDLVEVIVDRRDGERRQTDGPVTAERRHGDRRGGRFRLDHEANGVRVYRANGRLGRRCSTCGTVVELEPPDLREPPAWLSLEVVHRERPPVTTLHSAYVPDVLVRHTGEVEVRSATGRLVLSCSVPARPPEAYVIDDPAPDIAWS